MASSSSSSPEMSVPHSTNAGDPSLSTQEKLHEVLEDLSSRFILNLPEEELASLERVCFQVEQAHWYYEDFVREQDSTLPTMTLKKFSNSLFHVCPLLKHWGDDHEQTFQSFLAYKTRVPVCGAIMLNETWDKCLLVKGWKSTSAWSFPKGKINEQEPRHKCAVREVMEETGYDLERQINPADVVELSIKDQSLSLYIVPNVPEDYRFETRTRKEISKIAWFKLTDLPTWRRNKTVPGKFYLITPFIGPLKSFIRNRKPRDLQKRLHERVSGVVETEAHVSSEEDGHGDLDSHDLGILAQESSSQSSADNGPQTPSPLYTEATVNNPTQVKEPIIPQGLNMEVVDPHFARLLSSLSLSASAATTTGNDTSALFEPMDSQRLSVAQDPAIVQQVSAGPLSQETTVKPARTHPHSVVQRTSPTSSSATLQRPSSRTSRISSPLAATVLPTANQQPKHNGVSAQASPTTRRTNVTADLSPYMSRPNAVAAIPKQMKYITMLEHVVKESERMTPSLERQAAALEAAPFRAQHNGPAPSAFMPPPLPTGINGLSPPVYHRPGGIPTSMSAQHAQMQRLGPTDPAALTSDPFIARPRTTINSFGHGHGRPSMSEEQLRSLLSVPRPPTALPSGAYPPAYPPQPLLYPANRAAAPPNLRIIPQLGYPPQFAEPSMLSAPPVPSPFNLGMPRPNPANQQLLSILNSPNIPRGAPNNAAPGVLSGVGPR